MMKIFILFAMLFIPFTANSADGIINVESPYNVATTTERLEKLLNEKGMRIFNTIKHSESAAKIGVQLRETKLIIFGNPKAGSSLMKCQPSIAIDLPQKFLIWNDENNKVWISYNDIGYLKSRHRVKGCDELILKIGGVLASITKAASNK